MEKSNNLEKALKIKDLTSTFDEEDAKQNASLAALAYLGPVWIVPLLGGKNSKFARFHALQGIALFTLTAFWLFIAILLNTLLLRVSLWFRLITIPIWLCGFIFLAIAITQVWDALHGKARTIPFVGQLDFLCGKKED